MAARYVLCVCFGIPDGIVETARLQDYSKTATLVTEMPRRADPCEIPNAGCRTGDALGAKIQP